MASAAWSDGSWCWLEAAGTQKSRLARSSGAAITQVAAFPEIRSFAVGDGKAAWIAGSAKKWTIGSASFEGTGQSTVWTGDHEPRGLLVANHRVYWLDQGPPLIAEADVLPPLNSRLRLLSAPVEGGGTPAVAGEIMESNGLQIVGIHGGEIYVSALRGNIQGITAIYRVPTDGGPVQRVAAETGAQQALLAHDGTLYWTAPSREAAQPERVVCVSRTASDGRPVTLQDWMPYGGHLYETPSGITYIDGAAIGAVWHIGDSRSLPTSVTMPPGYVALSVGNNEVLLQSNAVGKGVSLYRVSLP